jgi:hypothetical protein
MTLLEEIFEGILNITLILLFFAVVIIYEVLTCWRLLLPESHWLRKKVEINLDL